ncbi:alcohol dehydrogenase catalytic domain-containing protein [Rhodococcus opacus]|uniref:alcohol dehydrogenase catalytic domain-containing protein n=1 Tax=Rhodococcus opacus TaxID=37919 RepID=UPI000AF14506|nr:alcohol dehydrogenase catalytic domain-containing protein [Rhodococcus opacus]
MTDTMRALVGGIGPEWVLGEVPVPRPGPGEVLIRNRAAATNNADIPMLAEADPTHGGHGKEFIAGFEYAGEVAALGEGVDTWQVGDPVMGSIPSAFAEYVVADHRFVLPRPEGLDPPIACALPTGLLTVTVRSPPPGSRPGRAC